jgi:hypothetical protein
MRAAALALFSDLEIRYIPPNQQRQRGPMETNCLGIVARMIRKFGLPHTTLTLRTIVESKGNESALIADIADGVSDLILAHPRWANLGLPFIEAFDQIDLAEVRKAAKATLARPLRAAITTLVCIQLTKILGPSRPPKPARPIKVKLPAKLPRAVTRVHEVEKNVALGMDLIALRATIQSNCAFGRQVRRRFEVDAQLAGELMKVARAFGTRPAIFTRLSWDCLVRLSSPSMSATARQAIEARVIAGEKIVASDIVRARGTLKNGRPPRRSADQPARMAA